MSGGCVAPELAPFHHPPRGSARTPCADDGRNLALRLRLLSPATHGKPSKTSCKSELSGLLPPSQQALSPSEPSRPNTSSLPRLELTGNRARRLPTRASSPELVREKDGWRVRDMNYPAVNRRAR